MPRKGENIYKRKDGRWEGRYIKSRTPAGKANYGYVYAKTYREAKAKLNDKGSIQINSATASPEVSSDLFEYVIQNVMKTACEFYQGDWVGFLQVDLELGLWTPYVWYNPHENDQTAILLQEFESAEFFSRWIDAMHNNRALFFLSLDELSDAPPEELKLYHHLNIRQLLAVPIKPRPTGFLIVRNPQRHITRSGMLQMLAFVLLSSINEQKLMQSMKMSLSPENIKSDTDVIINLFGNLEIYTSIGVLRESDLKSPKICRLLAYMLLNRKATIPAREIVEAIWPEEILETDNPGKNLRALIFRLRQLFSLISSYSLIETTPNGYCLNPKLNIVTDLQMFEKYWEAVQQSYFITDKTDILKLAVNLYKGDVLSSAAGEHWLIPTASHYSLRYLGMVSELLKTLAEGKDFHNLHKYAAQALSVGPANGTAYYWLIYSMVKKGASELAKTQLQIAQENLSEEDYHFYCVSPYWDESQESCKSVRWDKTDLENVILETLKAEIAVMQVTAREKKKESASKGKQLMLQLGALKKELENGDSQKVQSYMDYREGRITKEEFIFLRAEREKSHVELQEKIRNLEAEYEEYLNAGNQAAKDSTVADRASKLSEEELKQIMYDAIERVNVSDSQHIEIVWKFDDLFIAA